jgi:hypothetical protein
MFFEKSNNVFPIGTFDSIVAILDFDDDGTICFLDITAGGVAIRKRLVTDKLSHNLFVKVSHFHLQHFLLETNLFCGFPLFSGHSIRSHEN